MVTKRLLSRAQSRWVIKLEWPCGEARSGLRAGGGGLRTGRMAGKIQRHRENTEGLKGRVHRGLRSVGTGARLPWAGLGRKGLQHKGRLEHVGIARHRGVGFDYKGLLGYTEGA